MLEAEMVVKLGYSKGTPPPKDTENSRNGYTPKTVRSELGSVELDIPRERKGEFVPRIVPKYSRDISGIEEKVISLYARGMSTGISMNRSRSYMVWKFRPKWSARLLRILCQRSRNGKIGHWRRYTHLFSWMLSTTKFVMMGVNLEGNKDILVNKGLVQIHGL